MSKQKCVEATSQGKNQQPTSDEDRGKSVSMSAPLPPPIPKCVPTKLCAMQCNTHVRSRRQVKQGGYSLRKLEEKANYVKGRKKNRNTRIEKESRIESTAKRKNKTKQNIHNTTQPNITKLNMIWQDKTRRDETRQEKRSG